MCIRNGLFGFCMMCNCVHAFLELILLFKYYNMVVNIYSAFVL